ncbi:erythromycin esterase family protein [Kitasatospora sp. NPDC048722]|uniref:erythromycin esterase family protein n=1 Tax=Kitasatospora sp. NPDC048722 TaxID=3155639 RepID=UPI003400944A
MGGLIGRRSLLRAAAAAGAGAMAMAVPATATAARAGEEQEPVRAALLRASRPLRSTVPGTDPSDLRAFGAMVGDARVVGLGEATHGSHEFFAMKERVFRYLVEEKGFTAFALEMSWPAGLLIDEFVQGGPGDARQVVRAALGGSPWEREEFLHLVEWMRDHNRRNPRCRVHFMGDDIGAPRVGDAFFERVTGYVRRRHPELLPRFTELYTGLRPLDDSFAYLRGPLAERRRLATNAEAAFRLLEGQQGQDGQEFEWAVQHARSIAQTAVFLGVDLQDEGALRAAMLQRDRVMADNILWWHRRTGQRMLVSAHNGHVAYVPDDPGTHPKSQGGFLREALGAGYLPVGLTFGQGSFLSQDEQGPSGIPDRAWTRFTVGPPAPGTTEETLDRVRHGDFYLDVRSAPPAARAWLDTARPLRSIGTGYPVPLNTVRIAESFDVLVHLHRVREADALG